jgi:hypothetical protein
MLLREACPLDAPGRNSTVEVTAYTVNSVRLLAAKSSASSSRCPDLACSDYLTSRIQSRLNVCR